MKKNNQNLIIFSVLMGIVFLALSYFWFSRNSTFQLQDREKILVEIENQSLEVEVVNKSASIAQGLSHRDEIGSDGMLFVFPDAKIRSFWMKDMRFDLDFLWFRDNQVVAVNKNVPFPADNEFPVILDSTQPVDMVLELPSGKIDELGISIGSHLTIIN